MRLTMSLKGGIFTVLECSIQPSSEHSNCLFRLGKLQVSYFADFGLLGWQHTSAKMTHSFALLRIFVSFLGG